MRVPSDVLRMAKTREQKECVKWHYAKSVFFSRDAMSLSQGLALARRSEHQDARFLVSLFPKGAPIFKSIAVTVFLSQGDDARCMCWAALCGPPYQPHGLEESQERLMRQSAEKGYAFAQCKLTAKDQGEQLMWLEKAAAQGEPEAMWMLAECMHNSRDVAFDEQRAKKLCFEAALLGHAAAQCEWAVKYCEKESGEQFAWLRRSASQGHVLALQRVAESATEQLKLYDAGGSGRIVFETGAALLDRRTWRTRRMAGQTAESVYLVQSLYRRWCASAKRAVLCWLWLSRSLRLIRDIRLLIADIVWDQKIAWADTIPAASDDEAAASTGVSSQGQETVTKRARV